MIFVTGNKTRECQFLLRSNGNKRTLGSTKESVSDQIWIAQKAMKVSDMFETFSNLLTYRD